MATQKKLAEKSRWIPTDYESLARLTAGHFTDQALVKAFFQSYDKLLDRTRQDKIRFYQIKYFYTQERWKCLNRLAELYVEEKRPSLAYMCLIESLRLNSKQENVFQKAKELESSTRLIFPNALRESACMVSIITPTIGRNCELREAIRSVINQSFQDYEHIIVNNGGPDTIDGIIKEFPSPKIKYIKLKKKGLPSIARNEAIRIAQGKYICYLDDDDFYYPDHLQNLVSALEQGSCPVAYCNGFVIEGVMHEGHFKKTKCLGLWGGDFNKDILVQDNNITMSSIMNERSLFKQVGLFSEDLPQGPDWDMWLRFAEKCDFEHVNKSSSEWRHKTDNMTLMNRVGAHILGDIICHYYAFYKGNLAFVKYWINNGNRNKALEIYQDICVHYDEYFKTPDLISEMIDIAQYFKKTSFLKKLSRDYFHLNTRMFLAEIKKRRSLKLFLYVLYLLPQKILNGIILRLKRKKKGYA
ncbi:MAG: glycosyltransferase [Candidatus Omnitrophica bacterium]|nr:glycosyltransferase [Candidatus Omnitrophota bacterium]